MKTEECKHSCQHAGVNTTATKAAVMFIGLSAKPGTNDLCPSTNTGKLIVEIERRLTNSIGIYRTNAVKCAPLDAQGKLRYPTESEMRSCLPTLRSEIERVSPRVIVPLGGQVAKFLLRQFGNGISFEGFSPDFSYETYQLPFGQVMPIHHPSYVWVYRRKRVEEYVAGVADGLLELASV
jgi:DNA polymerase